MDTYTLPDLPYEMDALEPHYNAKLLELHHDKHWCGSRSGRVLWLNRSTTTKQT